MFRIVHTYINARDVKHKLVRNEHYSGGCISFRNWRFVKFQSAIKRKPLFFEALKKSVQQDGFRNPIVVYNFREGLMLSFGGSRLRVAQELDTAIPAIVVDFCNEYPGDEVTNDNYAQFFTDPPVYFKIDQDGVDTHYSLERNRRHCYDKAGMQWAEHLDEKSFVEKEFPWIQKS